MQVLMELNDTNLEFMPDESVACERLVFRLVNTLGDDSTALANMAVMFRGDEMDMMQVMAVFIAVKTESDFQRVGQGVPDDDDPRVFRVMDWTPSVPLPLGNNLLQRLRIVVLIDEHMPPTRVKFGADMVPFPEVFLEGNPRMKRRLGGSTIRFQGGTLLDIEQAMSALRLSAETPPKKGAEAHKKEKSSPEPLCVRLVGHAPTAAEVHRKEYWWSPCTIVFKNTKRIV